jgi:RNA-directed DNA polymerase
MSLKTPDNIRNLQKKLYLKAKTEPDFRFYLLYDKVGRPDILRHAYRLAKANLGAQGWTALLSHRSKPRGWMSGWPGSGSSCMRRRTGPKLYGA